MFDSLNLKFGAAVGQPPLTVPAPAITIFVGPNNSGKSVALREIVQYCRSGQVNANALVVDSLMAAGTDELHARALLERTRRKPSPGEFLPAGVTPFKVGRTEIQVSEQQYLELLISPLNNPAAYSNWRLGHLTIDLDGQSRITLTRPQQRGDLKNPQSDFARLLVDDAKRESLRKIIHDALGLYLALDISVGDQIGIRFSNSSPPDERTVHDQTIEYMRQALDANSASDGVKAFTGIILQLYAGDPEVIVIDEPEAFLHPSLAFKLGKEVAKLGSQGRKAVFIATHSPQGSPHFLCDSILPFPLGEKVSLTKRFAAGDDEGGCTAA